MSSVKEEGDIATMMHKDLVNKYEKGSKMASLVINCMDRVANKLEGKGLIKEAQELDIVSNTIEKMAKKIPAGDDRPAPIFSDSSKKVNDGKDHFPIPDKAHAQNALQRVNQYSEAPSWYEGSLKELKSTVVKKVKSKFPDINKKYSDDLY